MSPGRLGTEQVPSSAPLALAIVNARVWTGDPRRPRADAVFLRAGRIEAVGSSAEVRKRSDSAGVGAPNDVEIVLAIEGGHIVRDRDALAR